MHKELSGSVLNSENLRVWQHPALANAIELMKVFSFDPGDGLLATSLILASDQLIKIYRNDTRFSTQIQSMTRVQLRAFEWLLSEVESDAYQWDPQRSTSQVDKALNCGFLLLCSQLLDRKLINPTLKFRNPVD